MVGGGDRVGGCTVHPTYSEGWDGRDYNEVYLYSKMSIYVIVSEGRVEHGEGKF